MISSFDTAQEGVYFTDTEVMTWRVYWQLLQKPEILM